MERWAQSRTLPAGDVFRARLISALAAGKSYREIESDMQTVETCFRYQWDTTLVKQLGNFHKEGAQRTTTAASVCSGRLCRSLKNVICQFWATSKYSNLATPTAFPSGSGRARAA